MRGTGSGRKELAGDYRMLARMSRELGVHQRKINAIAKKVAKTGKSDAMYGLVESLDLVMTHIGRAKRELDNAGKKLKLV